MVQGSKALIKSEYRIMNVEFEVRNSIEFQNKIVGRSDTNLDILRFAV